MSADIKREAGGESELNTSDAMSSDLVTHIGTNYAVLLRVPRLPPTMLPFILALMKVSSYPFSVSMLPSIAGTLTMRLASGSIIQILQLTASFGKPSNTVTVPFVPSLGISLTCPNESISWTCRLGQLKRA